MGDYAGTDHDDSWIPDGPGEVSHLWFTIDSPEPYHLKRIVLRIYWDGEENPSVETPIGDFFGWVWGSTATWAIGNAFRLGAAITRALNCFLPHAVSEARAHYCHQ